MPLPDEARADPARVQPRSEREQVLAEIWSELLGVAPIGATDNFFELGGDSILSIQFVARAARLGLKLTPKDVFEHQNIRDLARVCRSVSTRAIERGPVTGAFPLLPAQRRFFEYRFEAPHHFNQSLLLQMPEPPHLPVLAAALNDLRIQHDGLRARFPNGDRVQQLLPVEPIALGRVDLSHFSEAPARALLSRACDGFQRAHVPRQGRVFRPVFFELGASRFLLLTAHHLVIDAVSWRILLEDLQYAYRERLRGRDPVFPDKTTSVGVRARELESLSLSDPERAYWSALAAESVAVFPDRADGEPEAERRIEIELTTEATDRLLLESGQAYRTGVADLLLAALALALDRDVLAVMLEGHGRETLSNPVDLSRTVGWFTVVYPVHLRLAPNRSPAAAVKTIKETLRNTPRHGFGYDVWRSERVGLATPEPRIAFNYLGRLDGVLPASSLFQATSLSAGRDSARANRRPFPLEITAAVSGGVLQIRWTFSPHPFQREPDRALGANLPRDAARPDRALPQTGKSRLDARRLPGRRIDANRTGYAARAAGQAGRPGGDHVDLSGFALAARHAPP